MTVAGQESLVENEGSQLKGVKKNTPPFLKWAGGKRWLLEKHAHLFDVKFSRFIEPFVGSGAVFFNLKPSRAILCDQNERLIEVYSAIRDSWTLVERYLREHHRKHSVEYYYQMRAVKLRSAASRAAQLIYLNRTCWNGLYRVNKKGEFNVPIGTKQNVLLDTDNFEDIARTLKNVDLLAGDFDLALADAGEGDFVFVDPPYTVKHNLNGFVKYNEKIFSWEDQVRLRDSVADAKGRGARIIVTNACHQSIKDLYSDIGQAITIGRSSVIAGKSTARGIYEEVLIQCY